MVKWEHVVLAAILGGFLVLFLTVVAKPAPPKETIKITDVELIY